MPSRTPTVRYQWQVSQRLLALPPTQVVPAVPRPREGAGRFPAPTLSSVPDCRGQTTERSETRDLVRPDAESSRAFSVPRQVGVRYLETDALVLSQCKDRFEGRSP